MNWRGQNYLIAFQPHNKVHTSPEGKSVNSGLGWRRWVRVSPGVVVRCERERRQSTAGSKLDNPICLGGQAIESVGNAIQLMDQCDDEFILPLIACASAEGHGFNQGATRTLAAADDHPTPPYPIS